MRLSVGKRVLGRGHTAVVYEGTARDLHGLSGSRVVAVKKYFNHSRHQPLQEQYRHVLVETRLLAQIGRHLNVVNLLGITRSIRSLGSQLRTNTVECFLLFVVAYF